jgi:hypothetical protein
MKIFGMKAGGIPLDELLMAGAAKPFLEGFLAPYIGNGSLFSGGVKLAAAMAIGQFVGQNKIGKVAQMALGMDGAEDVVRGVLGMVGGRTEQAAW